MKQEEIFERVRKVIVTDLGPTGNPRDPFEQKVTMEAKLADDLGADSLDTAELAMAFEDEFDIELDDEDGTLRTFTNDIVTVGDIVRKLEPHLTAQ